MPGSHPLSGRELPEQLVGLGTFKRDWAQALGAVAPQQARQQPFA